MKMHIGFLSLLAAALFVFPACEKDGIVPSAEGPEAIEARAGSAGSVYLIDNDAAGNNLLVFDRDGEGNLYNLQSIPTDGEGSGGGLGTQGAVIVSGQYVYACNAGSNEISVFSTKGQQISLVDVVSSMGESPASLTVHRDVLYVLNIGGDGNIAGFSISNKGELTFIPGSVQPLSTTTAGGAQVEFYPSGDLLVVTEKMTNMISIYPVDNNGVAGMGTAHPSVGETPFGFAFGKQNELIVSDAFGGAADASALTSYTLSNAGDLDLVTGPVATTETAACWVVVTNNGNFTYTTNTGSASVTGYSIAPDGSLTLLDADGVTGMTGMNPIDAALSRNSDFLYVLNTGSDSISIFAVDDEDGSLTFVDEITGLLASAVGIAAE